MNKAINITYIGHLHHHLIMHLASQKGVSYKEVYIGSLLHLYRIDKFKGIDIILMDKHIGNDKDILYFKNFLKCQYPFIELILLEKEENLKDLLKRFEYAKKQIQFDHKIYENLKNSDIVEKPLKSKILNLIKEQYMRDEAYGRN